MVPRGGEELIRFVEKNATMPVLIGGIGVCHTYVDKTPTWRRRATSSSTRRRAATASATRSRPWSCTRDVAERFLPRWRRSGREGRRAALRRRAAYANPGRRKRGSVRATEEDFGKEFLTLIASVKVVDSYDDAVDFIYRYSSGHSDAIVTENYTTAMRFLREVDTAVCYVNASTQFTDGAQFGLGAEIIDATQKFHARGPVGLREICTYKWIVFGNGQVRS